jgi:hypothetical protein
MSLLQRARSGVGTRAGLGRVTNPARAPNRDAEGASRAFNAALGRERRSDGRSSHLAPARLAGIEHEFAVLEHGRQLDFRELILDLGIQGPRLDPADSFAHRLLSGSVITADDREAEVAIAPVTVRPGFSAEADHRAAEVRDELLRLIGPDRSLAGYSTHLSLSMRDNHLDAAARLYARTFAPALMLLLDHRDAPGLLVRPRPGRLELGGAYLAGDSLRAALVFAAASARAVSGAVARDRAILRPGHRPFLPPILAAAPEPATIRYGWFVVGGAFGGDLYATGRSTVLSLADGRSMTAGEHLRRAWDATRPMIEESASPAELALVDAVVEGRLPLPCQLPRDRPDGLDSDGPWVRIGAHNRAPAVADHGGGARDGSGGETGDGLTAGRHPQTNPYGAVTQPQVRPAYSVRPMVLRWDFSLLELETRGTIPARAYAVVPAPALADYVARLHAGSLDQAIEAYLAQCAAPGSEPSQPDQVVTPGLYADTGSIADLLPLERTPITGELARTDKSRKGRKSVVPGPRTTPQPEPAPPPGTPPSPDGRRGRFVPVALLLGCVAIVMVGGGLLLGDGGPLAATPPPPVPSATLATAPTPGSAPSPGAASVLPTSAPPAIAVTPGAAPSATAAAAFSLDLALNYRHPGATSSVCLTVQSAPPQAGASVIGTISGPGVVGPSQISSTLLADGSRHGHFSIDRYGSYVITTKVTSHGVTHEATKTIDVTAAPGQGQCP